MAPVAVDSRRLVSETSLMLRLNRSDALGATCVLDDAQPMLFCPVLFALCPASEATGPQCDLGSLGLTVVQVNSRRTEILAMSKHKLNGSPHCNVRCLALGLAKRSTREPSISRVGPFRPAQSGTMPRYTNKPGPLIPEAYKKPRSQSSKGWTLARPASPAVVAFCSQRPPLACQAQSSPTRARGAFTM